MFMGDIKFEFLIKYDLDHIITITEDINIVAIKMLEVIHYFTYSINDFIP